MDVGLAVGLAVELAGGLAIVGPHVVGEREDDLCVGVTDVGLVLGFTVTGLCVIGLHVVGLCVPGLHVVGPCVAGLCVVGIHVVGC